MNTADDNSSPVAGGHEATRPLTEALTRREALGTAAALWMGGAGGQRPERATGSLSADDAAHLSRLSGYEFSENERRQMASTVQEMREAMLRVRAEAVPQGAEPAFRFDPWVPGVPLPRGRGVFRPSQGPAPALPGNPEEVALCTVSELGRLIKARRLSSVELTRLYLERLKRLNPKLLCVITLTEDLALRQAAQADKELAMGRWRGPLHGIPWGAKDLLATKDIPTTFGASPYRQNAPGEDATVVERLRRAGAVLVAKLSLGELAMGDVWFGGMTRCPWDPRKGSSGSSAGPAAATAAGLVGFSIGSETLGSIVSPCVRNGTTGLRPTYGRVPRTGAMALSWTMDKLGPICRCVEDCALVLHAIAGPDGKDGTVRSAPFSWDPSRGLRGLRIGVDEAAFEQTRKEATASAVYDDALARLRRAGAVLKPIRLPSMDGAFSDLTNIIDVEGAASFAELLSSGRLRELAQQGRYNWPNIFRTATTVAAVDYVRMMQLRAELQRRMAAAMAEFDLYVTPPYGSLVLTNLTGHPTLITRAGLVDGTPVMLEFTGQLYREDTILRAGYVFEQIMGVTGVWPRIA